MDEYLRKRERPVAAAAAAMEDEDDFSSSSNKKHKTDYDSPEAEPVNSPENSGSTSTANSTTSSVDKENVRSTDLKHKDSESEISSQFSRERSPSGEVCGVESAEFAFSSSVTKKKYHFKSSVEIPSAAEIEDFFATAEKQEQKRFAEKYNYDVAKDVPLEGRYEWIRLKP